MRTSSRPARRGHPPGGTGTRRRRRHARHARGRGFLLGLLTLTLAVGALLAVRVAAGPHPAADEIALPRSAASRPGASTPDQVTSSGATSAGTPLVAAGGPVAPDAQPVLRLAGPVPANGSGAFSYAPGAGGVSGRSDVLQHFRVAVEEGSGEDVNAFAAAVESTLDDPRSWTASGRLRLQRVPSSSPADFTVYLATAATAGRMCAAGGVNIRVGGRPYTSCRAPGKVIINLDRWRLSADHLVAAGVPLADYRTYVVNHEVGHQLGRHHEGCPGPGRQAPVMMQQTLFLKGCTANSWPYLSGRRYDGPPV